MRRIQEVGAIRYRRVSEQDPKDATERFLELFRQSRPDKADFLTPQREDFFRALIRRAGRAGVLNLSFLEIDGRAVASTLCWDHGATTYLYNNGFDPEYRRLSVGFVAKVLGIRDSIERGRRRYDFLKGAEDYKRRLGGRKVPLLRCRVHLNGAGRP
jgi:CelD/BcsL family acetyltransferase involved in cellulose biosynthesis